MIWTLVVTDERGTRELLLTDGVAIGRDVRCDISADHPELSRRHAEFRVTASEVLIFDLDSTNGIAVNGTPTRRAVLADGDIVKVAGFTIRLVEGPLGSASEDTTDGTRMFHAPAGTDAESTIVLAGPPPRDPPRQRAEPRTAPPTSALAVARQARTSWAGRVFAQVLSLGSFAAIAILAGMFYWHSRSLTAVSETRAGSMATWLATAAATANDQAALNNTTSLILSQSGVVGALIVGLDGHVLAPTVRAGELIPQLPGGSAASAIFGPRTVAGDGSVEAVRPVLDRTGARRGIAWVSFRARADDGGSGIVIVGPIVLVVFAASLLTASIIRRGTTRGLMVLNEDIDLAIAGQLNEVKDPIGARAVQEIAETVNYLIFRARAATGGTEPPLPTPGAAPARPAGTEASGSPAPAPVGEALLTADNRFRVTSVTPACAAIIGAPARELLGLHLVDALRSQSLTEAVLTCLGQLEGAGERAADVDAGDGEATLHVVVSRQAKDGPISVVMTPAAPREVPA